MKHYNYTLTPIKLGCEVRGISLQTEDRPEVIRQIKKDVHTHRLLVFKSQGIISGQRHVEISSWFGALESTFYQHEKSPHPDVFRVSNDRKEGCTGVGRTGWHIDGSFQPAPFAFSLYHMVSIPTKGNTVFAPLNEIVESLPQEKRKEWERLWMISDRQIGPIHPLIYPHPITGKKTMCFHLGMTCGYIWDRGTPDERLATPEEVQRINQEIHHEFVKDNGKIQYSHKPTMNGTSVAAKFHCCNSSTAIGMQVCRLRGNVANHSALFATEAQIEPLDLTVTPGNIASAPLDLTVAAHMEPRPLYAESVQSQPLNLAMPRGSKRPREDEKSGATPSRRARMCEAAAVAPTATTLIAVAAPTVVAAPAATPTNHPHQSLAARRWEEGDFIITDNLAVGHEASPETQYPRSTVGLRVLHRTTIKGIHAPKK